MMMLARAVGFVVAAMGMVIALNPKILTAVIGFWKKGNNVYLAAVIRLAFGILFLAVSPGCRVPIVIAAIGVLMIIGGGIIFGLGPDRIRAIFEWWEKRPPLFARIAGLMAMVIGWAIFYCV